MSPPLHRSLRKGRPAGQPCRSQDVGKLIEGGSAAPESVEGAHIPSRQAAGRPAAPKAWGAVSLRIPPASANIAGGARSGIVGAGPERILILEKDLHTPLRSASSTRRTS